MATKRKALGRGLGALFENSNQDSDDKEALRQIPIDQLERGRYQPRFSMSKGPLKDLADSITAQGVVQPIIVRQMNSGKYEIIAGERRWRAAQLAGLETIPAVVRNIPDEAAMAISLIENIQREDLNPMEEATAMQRLMQEFEMTHQQVAERVGRSRAAVSNYLRLLTLGEEVRKLLETGRLDMGHARALLSLSGAEQLRLGRKVAEDGLTVRQTEAMVRKMLNRPSPKKKRRSGNADIRNLEQKLSDKLGARVRIQSGKKGKGKLIIEYNSNDELDGILKRIR
ncbi:MAG: ParB/RepB/Spo0J family partition protein [Gammaproteobacteria bacterium]|nr:MAG: ParB/RepB/Spo0J family partition protein [Gammaproteobacteria bacterium]